MLFHNFAKLVHNRFNELSKGELFVTGEDHKEISDHYLAAFPEGTNPIYKTNTEHDCTCCKHFIRNIGNVVAIVDGKLESIWAVAGAEYPYDVVAKKLDALVTGRPITDLFRAEESSYGNEQTRQLAEDGSVKIWKHFHGKLATKHYAAAAVSKKGEYKTTRNVFKRGLDELKLSAINDVLDLISSGSLYRGAEHAPAIAAFMEVKTHYDAITDKAAREVFAWHYAGLAQARFRNTVIGTLITDLSDGVPLETAVRSFELKVAPTNYKRPTALITPSMVTKAMATVEELGLLPALDRRFAKLSDVSVNNVLWVNNQTQGQMKHGIAEILLGVAKAHHANQVADSNQDSKIGIDAFMSDVLPTATAVSILARGEHLSNFVSLTAPVHENQRNLFKWDNAFAWSYDGNTADSIKERVKAAGGNVTDAALRVSLAWFNFDDLDIHMHEPNGNHLYFANKDGKLDVDMNAGRGSSREPVENISFKRLVDGQYRVKVNQYNRRETSNPGFVLEVENAGKLHQFSFKAAATGTIEALTITVKGGVVTEIVSDKRLTGGGISQEKWGVTTETFVPVSTVMYSPNYWDGNAVGNKHWFFILEGCKNPEETRGIYNEYLTGSLEEHRKVFEVLGNKTKCPIASEQLSGLGFSSTRKEIVTVQVKTLKTQRNYNIQF